MRHPHYTGENDFFESNMLATDAASMRPPHYTGENRRRINPLPCGRNCFNEAPALHGGKHDLTVPKYPPTPASMRPPHYTGENRSRDFVLFLLFERFNEAPALHGGKPATLSTH